MTTHVFSLQYHPADCLAAAVGSDAYVVTVELRGKAAERRLELCYDIRTPLAALVQPRAGAVPQRRDALWRHTSCELFMAGTQEAGAYLEFNFAPSGDWAAYAFTAPRQGMQSFLWACPRDAVGADAGSIAQPTPRVRSVSSVLDEAPRASAPSLYRLQVEVDLPAPHLAGEYRVSPTVVLETAAGVSHWALRHPAARPDFHHPAGFSDPVMLP